MYRFCHTSTWIRHRLHPVLTLGLLSGRLQGSRISGEKIKAGWGFWRHLELDIAFLWATRAGLASHRALAQPLDYAYQVFGVRTGTGLSPRLSCLKLRSRMISEDSCCVLGHSNLWDPHRVSLVIIVSGLVWYIVGHGNLWRLIKHVLGLLKSPLTTCFQVKFVQLGANSEVASVILVMIYFFSWVVDTQVFT